MPPYICYFCNKIFDQREHLKNHFNKQKKCKFKKYDLNKKIKTEILIACVIELLIENIIPSSGCVLKTVIGVRVVAE